MILDYKSGGDLRYHLDQGATFNEQQTKFLIACILAGLDHIHSKGILHLDLKPENLIFDQNGFLHITDFGSAKFVTKSNHEERTGTPCYMAPELMTSHAY
jgi:serine/threonine protein kinase